MHVDPALFAYCTTRQREVLEAIIEHGECKAAAIALGVNLSVPSKTLQRVRLKAAKSGYAPDSGIEYPVAEGFELQGYSHYTKTTAGEPIWLKTRRAERDYWEGVREWEEKQREERRRQPPEEYVVSGNQFVDGDILFNLEDPQADE